MRGALAGSHSRGGRAAFNRNNLKLIRTLRTVIAFFFLRTECRPAPEARLLAWLSCARLSGSEASELALNPSPHEPDVDDDGDDDDDEDADDGDDDSHDQ